MLITTAATFPSLATPARTVAVTNARMHIHEHGAVTVAPTAAEATAVAPTEATPASKPECTTTKGGSIGSSRSRDRKSSPVIFNRNSSPVEAETASVSTMAIVDNDALSSYDRRKATVDTLPRQVHSNSPPTCAPTQQNASTHHGRTHHSPFPTCQLRSLFFASHDLPRQHSTRQHSAAPPPRVNRVHGKNGRWRQ